MRSGSVTISQYLVIASTDLQISNSWSPSARMCTPDMRAVQSVRICPEITSIGMESSHAPTTPVSAFVPPGPVVTQTTAGLLLMRA